MNYLFQFGFAPRLAALELDSYLKQRKIKYQKHPLSPEFLIITTKGTLDEVEAINSLGGTIRIASQVNRISATDQNSLQNQISLLICGHLVRAKQKKPIFSVSSLSDQIDTKVVSQSTKQILAQKDVSSRFISPESDLVQPIQFTDKSVTEFICVNHQPDSLCLFQTQAVSDVISWQKRDRDRPVSDPEAGMLPPKVARMMVNLTLTQPPTPDTYILDPFCGSGTILAESLVLGASCVGIDIDLPAINASQQNLDWLTSTHQPKGDFHLKHQDATTLKPFDLPAPITAIVTETDLGPNHSLSSQEIITTSKDLHALYSKFFQNLHHLVPINTRICIALPQFNHPESVKINQNLIDTCENSGYTLIAGPIVYSKPAARVKRAIFLLKKIDN